MTHTELLIQTICNDYADFRKNYLPGVVFDEQTTKQWLRDTYIEVTNASPEEYDKATCDSVINEAYMAL